MTLSPLFKPDPALDLVLERFIEVPPELVWEAWTKPEHISQWFTPKPWIVAECEIDLRPGGKAVRDTVNGVKVDFLVAGDYPGDGKPKPVRFPEPSEAATDAGRFRVVSLPRFVEMKLASGMTAPHRLQDLADVLRLVGATKLPREFGDSLDPYVRAKYDELWQAAQAPEDDY